LLLWSLTGAIVVKYSQQGIKLRKCVKLLQNVIKFVLFFL
jgi:hypothetical protein